MKISNLTWSAILLVFLLTLGGCPEVAQQSGSSSGQSSGGGGGD
jgi:hypothetical protein